MSDIYINAYRKFMGLSRGDGYIDKDSKDPSESAAYDEKADIDKNGKLNYGEWLNSNKTPLKIKNIDIPAAYSELRSKSSRLSLYELLAIDPEGGDWWLKLISSRIGIPLNNQNRIALTACIKNAIYWENVTDAELKKILSCISAISNKFSYNEWNIYTETIPPLKPLLMAQNGKYLDVLQSFAEEMNNKMPDIVYHIYHSSLPALSELILSDFNKLDEVRNAFLEIAALPERNAKTILDYTIPGLKGSLTSQNGAMFKKIIKLITQLSKGMNADHSDDFLRYTLPEINGLFLNDKGAHMDEIISGILELEKNTGEYSGSVLNDAFKSLAKIASIDYEHFLMVKRALIYISRSGVEKERIISIYSTGIPSLKDSLNKDNCRYFDLLVEKLINIGGAKTDYSYDVFCKTLKSVDKVLTNDNGRHIDRIMSGIVAIARKNKYSADSEIMALYKLGDMLTLDGGAYIEDYFEVLAYSGNSSSSLFPYFLDTLTPLLDTPAKRAKNFPRIKRGFMRILNEMDKDKNTYSDSLSSNFIMLCMPALKELFCAEDGKYFEREIDRYLVLAQETYKRWDYKCSRIFEHVIPSLGPLFIADKGNKFDTVIQWLYSMEGTIGKDHFDTFMDPIITDMGPLLTMNNGEHLGDLLAFANKYKGNAVTMFSSALLSFKEYIATPELWAKNYNMVMDKIDFIAKNAGGDNNSAFSELSRIKDLLTFENGRYLNDIIGLSEIARENTGSIYKGIDILRKLLDTPDKWKRNFVNVRNNLMLMADSLTEASGDFKGIRYKVVMSRNGYFKVFKKDMTTPMIVLNDRSKLKDLKLTEEETQHIDHLYILASCGPSEVIGSLAHITDYLLMDDGNFRDIIDIVRSAGYDSSKLFQYGFLLAKPLIDTPQKFRKNIEMVKRSYIRMANEKWENMDFVVLTMQGYFSKLLDTTEKWQAYFEHAKKASFKLHKAEESYRAATSSYGSYYLDPVRPYLTIDNASHFGEFIDIAMAVPPINDQLLKDILLKFKRYIDTPEKRTRNLPLICKGLRLLYNTLQLHDLRSEDYSALVDASLEMMLQEDGRLFKYVCDICLSADEGSVEMFKYILVDHKKVFLSNNGAYLQGYALLAKALGKDTKGLFGDDPKFAHKLFFAKEGRFIRKYTELIKAAKCENCDNNAFIKEALPAINAFLLRDDGIFFDDFITLARLSKGDVMELFKEIIPNNVNLLFAKKGKYFHRYVQLAKNASVFSDGVFKIRDCPWLSDIDYKIKSLNGGKYAIYRGDMNTPVIIVDGLQQLADMQASARSYYDMHGSTSSVDLKEKNLCSDEINAALATINYSENVNYLFGKVLPSLEFLDVEQDQSTVSHNFWMSVGPSMPTTAPTRPDPDIFLDELIKFSKLAKDNAPMLLQYGIPRVLPLLNTSQKCRDNIAMVGKDLIEILNDPGNSGIYMLEKGLPVFIDMLNTAEKWRNNIGTVKTALRHIPEYSGVAYPQDKDNGSAYSPDGDIFIELPDTVTKLFTAENGKYLPDVMEIIQIAGKDAKTVLKFTLPFLGAMIEPPNKEKLSAVKNAIKAIKDQFGESSSMIFEHGIPIIGELINTPDKWKKNYSIVMAGLTAIARSISKDKMSEFFSEPFSKAGKLMAADNGAYFTDVADMIAFCGDDSINILTSSLPSLEGLTDPPKKENIQELIKWLKRLKEKSGDNSTLIYKYGIPAFSKLLDSPDKWKKNSEIVLDGICTIALNIENKSVREAIFENALPALNESLAGSDIRYFIDLVEISKIKTSSKFTLFKYGLPTVMGWMPYDDWKANYGEIVKDLIDIAEATDYATANEYGMEDASLSEIALVNAMPTFKALLLTGNDWKKNIGKLKSGFKLIAGTFKGGAKEVFKSTIPSMGNLLISDNLEHFTSICSGYISMGEAVGKDNLNRLFGRAIPAIKDIIVADRGMHFDQLVLLTRWAGPNANVIIENGLPAVKGLLESQEKIEANLDMISRGLVELSREAGENAEAVIGQGFVSCAYLVRTRDEWIKNFPKIEKILIDATRSCANKDNVNSFMDIGMTVLTVHCMNDIEQLAKLSRTIASKWPWDINNINKNAAIRSFLQVCELFGIEPDELISKVKDPKEFSARVNAGIVNIQSSDRMGAIKALLTFFESMNYLTNDTFDLLDIKALVLPFETLEDKVLVYSLFTSYFKDKGDKMIELLKLDKKKAQDHFNKFSGKSFTELYYSLRAFKILGIAFDPKKFRQIDFDSIPAEKITPEIIGLLIEFKISETIMRRVIDKMKMDLFDLKTIDRIRERLLQINRKIGMQIIELKAKSYIYSPTTANNIAEKARFYSIWSLPEKNGADSAYSYDNRDIYVQQAGYMRKFLVDHLMAFPDEYNENLRKLLQLSEEEVSAIHDCLAKEAILGKGGEWFRIQADLPLDKRIIAQAEKMLLKKSRMDEQFDDMVNLSIANDDDLAMKISYYYKISISPNNEDKEYYLGVIKNQISAYVGATDEKQKKYMGSKRIYSYGQENLTLEEILTKRLNIGIETSKGNLAAKVYKVGSRLLGSNAALRRQTLTRLKNMATNTTVDVSKKNLIIENGIPDGQVRDADLPRGFSAYSVYSRAPKALLAIIVKGDPKKGARMDFNTEDEARDKGFKNINEYFKDHHRGSMAFDCSGAMVSDQNIPAVTVVVKGSNKNKSSTLEMRFDGLIMMGNDNIPILLNKHSISGMQLQRVMDLNGYLERQKDIIKSSVDHILLDLKGESLATEDLEKRYPVQMETICAAIVRQRRTELLLNNRDSALDYVSDPNDAEYFWELVQFGQISMLLGTLLVEENKPCKSNQPGEANRRVIAQFEDGSFAMVDVKKYISLQELAILISSIEINGQKVTYSVNLDTGAQDNACIYKNGEMINITNSDPSISTNRLAGYSAAPR